MIGSDKCVTRAAGFFTKSVAESDPELFASIKEETGAWRVLVLA